MTRDPWCDHVSVECVGKVTPRVEDRDTYTTHEVPSYTTPGSVDVSVPSFSGEKTEKKE